jgi:hypothetical protein
MFSALTDKNRSRPWRFVGTVVVGTVVVGAVVVVGAALVWAVVGLGAVVVVGAALVWAVLGLGCLCSDLIQVTRGVQVGGCEKCAGKDSRKRGQCDRFVVDAFFLVSCLVCAFIPFFSVLLFVFVSLEAFSSPVAPFVETVVSCLYLHRSPKLQFPGKFRHNGCFFRGLFMTKKEDPRIHVNLCNSGAREFNQDFDLEPFSTCEALFHLLARPRGPAGP